MFCRYCHTRTKYQRTNANESWHFLETTRTSSITSSINHSGFINQLSEQSTMIQSPTTILWTLFYWTHIRYTHTKKYFFASRILPYKYSVTTTSIAITNLWPPPAISSKLSYWNDWLAQDMYYIRWISNIRPLFLRSIFDHTIRPIECCR